MQTIEAAAQRMRQSERAAATPPPPPPAYSPMLRAAPAALAIKTRVLGELAEAAPAVVAPAKAAPPLPRQVPVAWVPLFVGVGIAATLAVQALWVTRPVQPKPVVQADPAVEMPAVSAPAALAPVAMAPVASAPVASPQAASAQAAPEAPLPVSTPDATIDVREAVAHWAAAWSARDVERYLGYYARDFKPDGGTSRAAWQAQRRARLTGPATIHVAVRDVRVERDGADKAVVRFTQDYAAGAYRETGTRKRLVMRREDGRWRIAAEGADT